MEAIDKKLYFILLIFLLVRQSSAESVQTLTEKHDASFKSVINIQCKARLDFFPELEEGNYTGFYRRIGMDYLAITKCNKFTSYESKKSGIRKYYQLFFEQSPQEHSKGHLSNIDAPLDCDPFRYGLLTFWGNSEYAVPFSRFQTDGSKLVYLGKSNIDGHETQLVEVKHSRCTLKIHFDPKVNYLCRAVYANHPNVETKFVTKVLEFSEISPGIYFPIKIELLSNNKKGNEWNVDWRMSIFDIQLNPNINKTDLDITFPKGCVVADHLKKKMYVADGSGGIEDAYRTPEGKEITLTENPPGQIIAKGNEESEQSKTEGWSLWDYFLPICVGLFVTLVLLYALGKRRS